MTFYNVNIEAIDDRGFAIVKIGFGDPAQNTDIVPAAVAAAEAIKNEVMGCAVFLNGPASLPVGMALAHELSHVAKAIAGFDPKLGGYVVAISHDPDYRVGQLIKL